jgi:RNA-directed DNA polymerase
MPIVYTKRIVIKRYFYCGLTLKLWCAACEASHSTAMLLGIPTVMDRVIQQAVAQVLTAIFDPTFSESSFGFRPGRNARQAIRQVQATVKDGKSIAVDIDLAKFFDTVNHDVLMNLLGRTIADKRVLTLIGR